MKRAIPIIIILLTMVSLSPRFASLRIVGIQRNAPDALGIQQFSESYAITTSGEGVFNGWEGNYSVAGSYVMNISDFRVVFRGRLPLALPYQFSYALLEERNFSDSYFRRGVLMAPVNSNTSYTTFIWKLPFGSYSLTNVPDDPSGDGYVAYIDIPEGHDFFTFEGQVPFFLSTPVITSVPGNVILTFENGSQMEIPVSQVVYPPNVYSDMYVYCYPEKLVLTFVFNATPWENDNMTLSVTGGVAELQRFPLMSFFLNGSVEYYISPTDKAFNVSFIGRWVRVSVDVVALDREFGNITGSDVDAIIERLFEDRWPSRPAISVSLVGVNWTNDVFIDYANGYMEGWFVIVPKEYGLLNIGPFVNKAFPPGVTEGDGILSLDLRADASAYVESALVALYRTYYKFPVANADIVIPSNASQIIREATLWWFVDNNATTVWAEFYYEFNGVIESSLSPRQYYLYDALSLRTDIPWRVEAIRADGVDAVVLVDGSRYVTEVSGGEGGIHSGIAEQHDVVVKVYPKVEVTIRVVDARGMELSGATIKLVNQDTGRTYYALAESPATLNMSSGVYSSVVRILVHEEEHNATVTLSGGVLTIRLDADLRAITGETIRVLLLYVPVALLIPIVFMFSAVPLLIKKRRRAM